MDWLDVVIVISVFFFLFIRVKKKKAEAARRAAPRPVQPTPYTQSNETVPPIGRENSQPNFENFEENSSKNEEYFSYKTSEPEIPDDFDEVSFYSEKTVENIQQSTENEQIKTIDLQFDTDEITKGVIYSTILEKPYNQ